MIDAFGRDLRYLRISITDRCNFRCQYCIPEDGIEAISHEDLLSFEEISELVAHFVKLGVTKIRLTGGEPLVRKDVVELIRMISSHTEVNDIALTTNGTRLKEMAQDLKDAGLNRVNISLDSLKDDRFKWITRGGDLNDAVEGIEEAKRVGLGIKINCVINKGINDDEIVDFMNLTISEGFDVRFIELMPIGETADYAKKYFYSNQLILKNHADLKAVQASDTSSPASYYQYKNGKGRVGLISPLSCNFCANCNRMRLTSDGKLKPCLHSDIEIDLKEALRNGEDVDQLIMHGVDVKPEKHLLDEHKYIVRTMNKIGG